MSVQSIDTPIRPPALPLRRGSTATTGLLSCLVAIVAFSLTLPATRAAVPELGPFFVASARSVLSGGLALLVVVWRREAFPRRFLPQLLLTAACVVFGFPFATAYGMSHAPANHGTVVTALVPMATASYAALRNAERPSRSFWMAAGLGVATVLWFGYTQSGFALSAADAWLLASVVLAAVGYTEGARLAKTLGGARVISWALVLSIAPGLPLVIYSWPGARLFTASGSAFLGLGYVCVVSMYLGMIVWYHGLSRGSVARASQLQLLQPILGLGWSWWLLGERIGPSTLLAALVVVACVVWSRRSTVTMRAPNAPSPQEPREHEARGHGVPLQPTNALSAHQT